MHGRAEETRHIKGGKERGGACILESLDDERISSWRYFLDLEPTKKVLHICEEAGGAGFTISRVSSLLITVHYDMGVLGTLKKHQISSQHHNMHFVCCDNECIPLKNDVFDIIILENIVQVNDPESFRRYQRVLMQAFSLMKSGGQVLITAANPFVVGNLFKKCTRGRRLRGNRFLRPRTFFGRHNALLSVSGFSDVRTAYFFQGPIGEAYSVYGDSYYALDYYYQHFTAMKNIESAKRFIYYLLARTNMYRFLADLYLFMAFK
jgi:SAM-dependent methyltransferase